MTRRIVWGSMLALVFAVLIGLWLSTRIEQVEVEHWTPPGKEARHNPFLAMTRFLASMGRPLRPAGESDGLAALPPGGVVLLDAQRRSQLTPARIQGLLDWVKQGGYLIVAAEAPGVKDPLLDFFQVDCACGSQRDESESAADGQAGNPTGNEAENTPENAPENTAETPAPTAVKAPRRPDSVSVSVPGAELEWPIDILITLIWVAFGANMIGTIIVRRVQHIYAAIWWYLATFLGVAILHVVNSFELPISLLKSYSIYAGAQDAVVQWWYGHNAVAFFLTTPFLGLMYYYLPKAANRPIYSYKLSIIHFWSLIFLYMWAGPHHLLYQALPDWAQALGVTFSIMLIAPSWGGMINGLLTLRGAWDRVRDSAALKFLVVAVTAYGMSTFEGPMMSLKSVNQITHFTDWTIAHTHIAAMGWNGGIVFGMFYWLVPMLFRTKLFSEKLANMHFWLSTLSILLYAIPLYWSAVTQWLMLREYTDEGFLAYPNFLETLTQILPMYTIRIIAGVLFMAGFILMMYNLFKTMAAGSFENNEASEAPALVLAGSRNPEKETVHRWLERKGVRFSIIAFIALAIGGAVEIIPMIFIQSNVPTIESVKPYTPLELEGRDIYIKEGCYTCHSQMVRPFRWETDRYGEYSKIGEFVYDHPFQWGSRRTGPDLARAGYMGGPMYKNAAWHYNHFMDPQKMNEQSIMPKYPWLAKKEIDLEMIPKKIRAMQTLGVPYPEGYDLKAVEDLMLQAQTIAEDLKVSGIEIAPTKQMIAMIAYMHKLGKDIMPAPAAVADSAAVANVKEVALLNSAEDMAAAKQIFTTICAVCHGPEGKGIPPAFPDLTDNVWIKGNSPAQVYHSIAEGNIAKGMISYKTQYSEKQITQLTSYVLTVLNKK